jgi:hypothetical protein
MKQFVTHYVTAEVKVYLAALAYFTAMTMFSVWYV